jgi:hypothetical protein
MSRAITAYGWRRSVSFAGIILLISMVFYILTQPLPRGVVRSLVLFSDSCILTNYTDVAAGQPTRLDYIRNATRKTLVTLIQYSLAHHFEAGHASLNDREDVDRLLNTLLPLKQVLLNPHVLDHIPSERPTILSGIGYCDQVNGVAALHLARKFPKSQTFNVTSPTMGHTIGRVWSIKYGDWLYYDMFYSDIMVYVLDQQSGIRILARVHPNNWPATSGTPEEEVLIEFYRHSREGWVHNEFSPTFGSYVYSKVRGAILRQTLASIESSRSTRYDEPEVIRSIQADEPSEERAQHMAKLFLRARLEHLLGDSHRAYQIYQQVASYRQQFRSPILNDLTVAASVFSQMISTPI